MCFLNAGWHFRRCPREWENKMKEKLGTWTFGTKLPCLGSLGSAGLRCFTGRTPVCRVPVWLQSRERERERCDRNTEAHISAKFTSRAEQTWVDHRGLQLLCLGFCRSSACVLSEGSTQLSAGWSFRSSAAQPLQQRTAVGERRGKKSCCAVWTEIDIVQISIWKRLLF